MIRATSTNIMSTVNSFTPQPQETYLGADALTKLKEVKIAAGRGTYKLDERLKSALQFLSTSAGEINDRGHQERAQHARKLNRLAKSSETEPENEAAEFRDFQDQVKSITNKLDLSTRKVIDDRIWLQDAPDAIDKVIRKSASASNHATQTQQSNVHDDYGIEGDENTEHDGQIPVSSENAIHILTEQFSNSDTAWRSLSLTERYANNNDYKDFYGTVFDANNQEEDRPPMPHESLWFAVEEGRESNTLPPGSQRQQRNSQDDSDVEMADDGVDDRSIGSGSDIEIHAERTRLTCPITLKYFEEPLKSSKCPHAFEKRYILKWLHDSFEVAPITPALEQELSQISNVEERLQKARELRPKVIRCPECNVPLAEKDLRPDPVLVRMVKREIEKQKREAEQERLQNETIDAEDSDDDDDLPKASQRRRVVPIGSSPARSVRPRLSGRIIKNERSSMVPQTQIE